MQIYEGFLCTFVVVFCFVSQARGEGGTSYTQRRAPTDQKSVVIILLYRISLAFTVSQGEASDRGKRQKQTALARRRPQTESRAWKMRQVKRQPTTATTTTTNAHRETDKNERQRQTDRVGESATASASESESESQRRQGERGECSSSSKKQRQRLRLALRESLAGGFAQRQHAKCCKYL